MDAGARYGSFSLRTQCRHCGQPLPLHEPELQVTCSYCLNEVELSARIWQSVLDAFEERDSPLRQGERERVSVHTDGLEIHLEVGCEIPQCEKCHAAFAVDALEVGRDHNFACVACGDPASTHAAPAWLREVVPTVRQSYSTDPDTLAAGEALSRPEQAIKPVVFSCPQCGGALKATEQSERVLGCQYCEADVYLPDEIWRRLHPVKTVQRWYLRFEGKTRTMLAEEKEALAREQRQREQQQREQRMETTKELARQQKERDIAALKRRAWNAAWTFLAVMCIGIGADVAVLAVPTLTGLAAILVAVGALAVCLVVLFVATHRVGQPIQRRTGHDRDWMIFCTWFWLPFVMLFPLLGSVFALWRAVVLARGNFDAATITSNSSSRSYAAVKLPEGEGRPAAIVFATLAVFWPLLGAGTLRVFASA